MPDGGGGVVQMKIRTQLIVAFLLLAILPMSVIVLGSYVSSQRAVRQAVEAEASLLTADMESRMERVRGETRRRVARLGELPFSRLADTGSLENQERERLYDSLVGELGDTAPLVDSFEFIPMAWEASTPEPGAAPEAPASPPAAAPRAVVIEMHEVMRQVEEDLRSVENEAVRQELRQRAEEGIAAAAVALQMAREEGVLDDGAEGVERWVTKVRLREQAEAGGGAGIGDDTGFGLDQPGAREWRTAEEAELVDHTVEVEAIDGDAEFESFRVDFDSGLKIPVREDGRVVGEVLAKVKGEELLRRVLGRTRRTQDEVPFALDAEGRLFTINEDDRSVLEGLPLGKSGDGDRVLDNWVVVTSEVPGSGMSFGIARPIRESLAEIRRTALRNFAFGTGLIGLALLGVLPISRRMSHNVLEVTAAAKSVAHGDLSTRVPVRSKNEIGQLATAFNRMAEDLATNQEKLLAQERSRRDHEVERTLMQAEIDRQTNELEEARAFQLSLLPKALPEHARFELAVEMRTATEVGGDYYDFQLTSDGVLTAAVGDATGHGARAGTMVTVIKSLFSAHPPGDSLAGFLSEAGTAIRRMDLGRMAMALALVRLEGSRLTLAAAGMPPVLLYRRRTGRVEEIEFAGMPLGSFSTTYGERSLDVAAGDTLLVMSDGLPELPNADGEPLGYARAGEAFERFGERPLDELIEELCRVAEAWSGGGDPADDVTFVALRVR